VKKLLAILPWGITFILLILILLYLSLSFGAVQTPPDLALRGIFHRGSLSAEERTILDQLRLPRTLLALLCGGGLGVSGLILQTFFRNPLASPDLLGISSASGFGVAVSLLMREVEGSTHLTLPALGGAIAGALLVLTLLLLLAPLLSTLTLLVGGLLLSLFFGALTQLLLAWVHPESLQLFYLWSQGGFTRLSLEETLLVAGILLPPLGSLLFLSSKLDALLLGEEYAVSLGLSLTLMRVILILLLGVIIAVITLAVGPLAFLGVAVPHGARGILRTNHHAPLLLCSFLLGGGISLSADLLIRLTSPSISYPLNALFALLGIPVVAFLLLRQSRGG
jgi:iron complex transport system permease protein